MSSSSSIHSSSIFFIFASVFKCRPIITLQNNFLWSKGRSPEISELPEFETKFYILSVKISSCEGEQENL